MPDNVLATAPQNLFIPPTKPFSQRPIDEELFADDVIHVYVAEEPRVEAVSGVITHDQEVIGAHCELPTLCKALNRQMPLIQIIWVSTSLRYGIDISKMRRGTVQPRSIDDEMMIRADLDALIPHSHHAFDVKLITRHVPATAPILFDASSRKHRDLSPFRLAEIIRDAIHE